jgi:hypothetical protein
VHTLSAPFNTTLEKERQEEGSKILTIPIDWVIAKGASLQGIPQEDQLLEATDSFDWQA